MDEKPPIHIMDVTDVIEREGWNCPTCGHRHAGRTLAFICVGCPCDQKPPKVKGAADDRP